MSKISLQMYTMRNFTKSLPELADTVKKLSDIGFKNLQYSIPDAYDPLEVKKIFDANGIKNDSVFCPAMALEEKRDKVAKMCEIFDTKRVRIDSIPRSLSETASGYKMFAHYLNEMSELYASMGIKVLYHFHSFEFIKFGNTTGIEILLNETNPDFLLLNPDTHWIQSGGKNPADFLEKYKDRYEYIHTKDYSIAKMGPTWENTLSRFAPVGEGNLDWDGIIKVCEKNGVQIYAIEQDDCYGRDEFECVASSFNFLKNILGE
ncbi:MAG: sugar phosphate isomerase/epimerase [Clostridia bacterium]|nr:sugar phosphate isomerase/epimerase [Clostridia bacterium]